MMQKLKKQRIFSHYILLWLLVVLIIVGILSSNVFLSPGNLNAMIIGRVTVGLIAIAMTICLAAGEMDISMGYMLGSCIMVAAWAGSMGAPAPVVLLIALLMGIVYGSFNGFLIVFAKIPSTIVTLASGMIFYSISMATNNSKSITGVLPKAVTALFKTRIFGQLPSVWVVLLLFVLAYWMLEHTPLGKQIYAMGFSEKVARLAGIRTRLLKFLTFAMSGAIVGVAALLTLGQSGNAYINTGPSYLMPCLAVAFLSITTHRVGRYNIVGTFVALLALGVAYNIAGLAGAPFWFENIVNGVILVGVVLLNGRDSRTAHSG